MTDLAYYSFKLIAGLAVPLPNVADGPGQIQKVLNIVFAVAGSIAVLIIVMAGLKYITSGSNPSDVSTAKNAIIYSLIGLVVIMTAFAIVNFVVAGIT